jgi:hypothetical protein
LFTPCLSLQLSLQLAGTCAMDGFGVAFIDTAQSFSLQRLNEMHLNWVVGTYEERTRKKLKPNPPASAAPSASSSAASAAAAAPVTSSSAAAIPSDIKLQPPPAPASEPLPPDTLLPASRHEMLSRIHCYTAFTLAQVTFISSRSRHLMSSYLIATLCCMQLLDVLHQLQDKLHEQV